MDISGRLSALRHEMEREHIDIYIIPSEDYHQSEYVGEYFKVREFISGFTGSAGTAVITPDKAGLWTDGRYFIQAEQELAGTGIILYRMGEPGVDTIRGFLEKELPDGGTIGFDGRTSGISSGREYAEIASGKHGRLSYGDDLIGRIWSERPPLPSERAWRLPLSCAGENAESKLSRVRREMTDAGADVHLLSSLDDIAWLLNIRGNDIAYCPLVLSYMLVFRDHAELFADEDKFSEDLRTELDRCGVVLRPYTDIYQAVRALPDRMSVLLDPERVNYMLYRSIPGQVRIIEKENPEILMKSCKNEIEAGNIRNAHIKDAVAHTKFMYRLKKIAAGNADADSGILRDPETSEPLTETKASGMLEKFRMQQEGYIEPSFEPISAFGERGAIVHYSASPDTDSVLCTGKMLLMDTGGHYLEGSTDITRTIALGDVPPEEKKDFTLTARAMVRLMNTVFLHGCSGTALDLAAREVFWKEHLNYNHGTGHGVGYLLNVHEAPVGFRWKEGRSSMPALEKNMVISDEPGIYIKDSHGVRLENLLLVCENEENEYGRFMHFEPLTLVPVDLDALLPDRMTQEERTMLNDYHRKVYETVGPLLEDDEREWLRRYTRSV